MKHDLLILGPRSSQLIMLIALMFLIYHIRTFFKQSLITKIAYLYTCFFMIAIIDGYNEKQYIYNHIAHIWTYITIIFWVLFHWSFYDDCKKIKDIEERKKKLSLLWKSAIAIVLVYLVKYI